MSFQIAMKVSDNTAYGLARLMRFIERAGEPVRIRFVANGAITDVASGAVFAAKVPMLIQSGQDMPEEVEFDVEFALAHELAASARRTTALGIVSEPTITTVRELGTAPLNPRLALRLVS